MDSFVLRRARKGSAASGSGILAVAMALAVVACDAPIAELAAPHASHDAHRFELLQAVEKALARLEVEGHRAWWAAPDTRPAPVVRARLAAEAFRASIADVFPLDSGGARIHVIDVRVWVDGEPSEFVPADYALRARGTLQASRYGEGEVERPFDVVVVDPAHAAPAAYLEGLTTEQANDPRSVVMSAAAGRLSRLLSRNPGASNAEVERELQGALSQAAAQLEADLGLRPAPMNSSTGVVGDERATDLPTDARGVAAFVGPEDLRAALLAWIDSRPLNLARTALRSLADGAAEAIKSAALALLDAETAPVRRLLEAIPWINDTLADLASGEFAHFLDDLAESAHHAARAADLLLARLVAPPGPTPPGNAAQNVQLRAQAVRLAWEEAVGPVVVSGRVLRPFEAVAGISFELQSTVVLPVEGANPIRVQFSAPAYLRVAAVSAAPVAHLAYALRSAATSIIANVSAPFGVLVDAMGLLEDARREVDRRLFTLRERVTHKIEESSAGSFSRLLFRILDGIADGNDTLWHRALYDFLERYFADELRDALTVNFTVAGINFSLIPDPIRQQVSIEHREGPHAFGVRLRRVMSKDDPFIPKWNDHGSLALELYWLYHKGTLDAGIVIDPLLRTDEGLLRFNLRSLEGEGLAISLVAPRVLRREGVFELALSSVLPGGLPVAVTPTGGIVTLDVGARIEIAAVRLPTLVRWILRAVEDAWFDTVANRTVGEVVEEFGARETANVMLEHFVQRLADTAVEQASRILTRLDVFARVSDLEAGGVLAARAEVSLSVREPLIVFREMASDWARLFRDALSGATAARPPAPGLLDWLPSAVHERVGIALSFSVHGGLDTFFVSWKPQAPLPGVDLSLGLFFSMGALSTFLGRSGVHAVFEMTLGLEGMPPGARKALHWWRLGPDDGLDLVWLRVETLSGPKILISEVLPAPIGNDTALEFVELYNPGYAEEVLTGWSLRDAGGSVWRLPDGTRIGPGGTLVIARSAGPFLHMFGVAPAVPTLTLSLNDEGDHIELVNRGGLTSDEVAWGPFAELTRAPNPGRALARLHAARPPLALPGSALMYTGSEFDFAVAAPSPGEIPGA